MAYSKKSLVTNGENNHITHQYVDIKNIPINEYFNLIINVDHSSLSIYLNGKFIRTLLFGEMPIFSDGNMYLNYNKQYV